MQQRRWSHSLALAPLIALMSCGSQTPAPTPPSQAAGLSRVITSTTASNDDSTVTFKLGLTGSHHFYRVYIDRDQKAGTGFGYAGVGAELLIENAYLFRYTGSGSDWSWALVGGVTFSKTDSLATWTVTRSALGETDPCNAAADLLFDIDDGTAPVVHETLTRAATCPAVNGTGGVPGSGGVPATGGVPGTGGVGSTTGVGGTSGAAGSTTPPPPPATGGTTGTGGSTTPPPPATGGTTGTGGSTTPPPPPATGGTTGTGGSTTPPPPPATGGTTGTGGSTTPPPPPATGGTTGTGGSTTPPPPPATGGTGGSTTPPPATGGHTKSVFVIALENEPAAAIYGSSSAPYINKTLLPQYARATAFTDPLSDAIPSEPHYVWMEAGTNAFSDHTFTTDADPDASNSTSSTAHLTTQMMAASPAISWLGWMEGLTSSGSGACPISSDGFYAAKHDPFVFFQDIVGRTPSATSSVCSAHHRAYTASSFAQALSQGTVAQYNFIAPNVCNDMHGDSSCPGGSDVIATGDSWLATNLPPLIQYVNANDGVIFLVWDEPEGGSPLIPFLAIGPHVKPGYTSSVSVTHSALVKTVEKIFGLPILPSVASANDFGDLFQPGFYP
jgi:hypothetical protein